MLLRSMLALGRAVVIIDWAVEAGMAPARADLVAWIRQPDGRRGGRGRCRARLRVDRLYRLSAVAIDEVKYKKGQRYLTVVCNHATGKVVWAAKGRSKDTVAAFFDALGEQRSAALQFVTADGADWIHDVVALRAKGAVVCLDTYHVISWATRAVDDVRREEWNALRRSGAADAAK